MVSINHHNIAMGLPNTRPVVHTLYEPSTGLCQYVVADQFTKRCIVINPIHEIDSEGRGIATAAPDAILSLIKTNGYTVDWLLETQPTGDRRTSVYYLRMQLLESQGFAPRTCGGANVTGMKKLFERKYGNRHRLTTDYHSELQDGDNFSVGNIKITAVQLDGLGQEHLGYVVGEYLFGLSPLAQLTGPETVDEKDVSALRLRHLWLSIAKVMAYPPQYRIYLDRSPRPVESGDCFTTVHNSRQSNMFAHMEESDFVNYWKTQLRQEDVSDRPKSRRRLPSPKQNGATSKG
jgi:hypothetical protein